MGDAEGRNQNNSEIADSSPGWWARWWKSDSNGKNSPQSGDDGSMAGENECGICLRVQWGFHYLCENGHSLCHKCFLKVGMMTCPYGRCSYSNPPERNLELEDRIRQWQVDNRMGVCQWNDCMVLVPMSGRARKEHHDHCEDQIKGLRTFPRRPWWFYLLAVLGCPCLGTAFCVATCIDLMEEAMEQPQPPLQS